MLSYQTLPSTPGTFRPTKVLCCFLSALLWMCSVSYAQNRPQTAGQASDPPALLLGAAWYPEQWPESRWNADLDLMQKAHMHVVRVA